MNNCSGYGLGRPPDAIRESQADTGLLLEGTMILSTAAWQCGISWYRHWNEVTLELAKLAG